MDTDPARASDDDHGQGVDQGSGGPVDLTLTDEQRMLRTTARRFLDETCPISTVRGLADQPAGFDRGWWRRVAELGWLALLATEHGPAETEAVADAGEGFADVGPGPGSDAGGVAAEPGWSGSFGFDAADAAVVAGEWGRSVAPGPVVATNLAVAALAAGGDDHAAVRDDVVNGAAIATWCAGLDDVGLGDGTSGSVCCTPRGARYVVSGTIDHVEGAGQADWLVVLARSASGPCHLLVPTGARGVEVDELGTIDLVRRLARVRFHDVLVDRSAVMGSEGRAGELATGLADAAVVLHCAESLGAARAAHDLTVRYAFDRYSFGRPLASYQALKHRFADQVLVLESGTAALDGAVDASPGPRRAEMASVAASYLHDHLPELIHDCVQLHGGIGVTWEHDLHLYLRRVMLNRSCWGTPRQHRERLAGLLGLDERRPGAVRPGEEAIA